MTAAAATLTIAKDAVFGAAVVRVVAQSQSSQSQSSQSGDAPGWAGDGGTRV